MKVLFRAILISAATLNSLALADQFNFTTLDLPFAQPPFGLGQLQGPSVNANGISNAGVIVGDYLAADGTTHGFMDNHGLFSKFDFPVGLGSSLNGINSSGQLVGEFEAAQGLWIGIVDTGTHDFIASGGLAAPDSFGINDSGTVVGPGGILTINAPFTPINVPGAFHTTSIGINDAGQVVGGFTGADNVGHGFLDTGGTFTTIDFPGAFLTLPRAINSAGEIGGTVLVTEPNGRLSNQAYVDIGGHFSLFAFPGATATLIGGINDQGDIVGSYIKFTDQGLESEAFLATPVPEPSSITLLGAALGILGWLESRRKSNRP